MSDFKWCCDCAFCVKKFQKHNRSVKYVCSCEKSDRYKNQVSLETKVCGKYKKKQI